MWVVQRRPVSANSLSTSPIPRQPLLLILFPLLSALSTTPKDKQIKPKTILLLSHLIPSPYYPDNPISQISLTSSYGTHFLFFNSAYKSSEWRPEKRDSELLKIISRLNIVGFWFLMMGFCRNLNTLRLFQHYTRLIQKKEAQYLIRAASTVVEYFCEFFLPNHIHFYYFMI